MHPVCLGLHLATDLLGRTEQQSCPTPRRSYLNEAVEPHVLGTQHLRLGPIAEEFKLQAAVAICATRATSSEKLLLPVDAVYEQSVARHVRPGSCTAIWDCVVHVIEQESVNAYAPERKFSAYNHPKYCLYYIDATNSVSTNNYQHAWSELVCATSPCRGYASITKRAHVVDTPNVCLV